MIKVSVVVPIYNTELYLKQCIDSILKQTFKEFELILVDDGSTDRSGQICDGYSKEDIRIRVFHEQNSGVGMARNLGIDKAVGEYIIFIDPDDWIEINMIEDMYKKMEREKVDLIIWSFKQMIYDIQDNLLKTEDVIAPEMKLEGRQECIDNFVQLARLNDLILGVPWNKLYSLKIIKENNIRFSKLKRRQDIIFNIDYYEYVNSLSVVGNVYSYYRGIDRGYASKVTKDYLNIAKSVYTHFKQAMERWEIYEGSNKEYIDNYFLDDVIRVSKLCTNPNWKMNFKDKNKYILQIMNDLDVCEVGGKDLNHKVKGIKKRMRYLKIECIKNKKSLSLLTLTLLEEGYNYLRYRLRVKNNR